MTPPSRTSTAVERPEGLVYRPDFLSREEERALGGSFEEMEFFEVKMRGQVARRTTRHFGYTYDYVAGKIAAAEPVPESLLWLRERAAALADLAPEELAEALVTRYPPAAGIGWHRDAPMFGPKVVGISLLSPCRMRFRRDADDRRRVYELALAPRSAYVLGGASRSAWQHSIPATKGLRYSVTFRTVRGLAGSGPAGGGAVPDSSGQER
jgi:alkylated DNA repair dioxygenase AlkB